MARKPNHAFQKRQREMARAAKKAEKAERRRLAREGKLTPDETTGVGGPADAADQGAPAAPEEAGAR